MSTLPQGLTVACRAVLGLKLLGQPLKIRLVRADGETELQSLPPAELQSLVMEPLATFRVLEQYLLPRVTSPQQPTTPGGPAQPGPGLGAPSPMGHPPEEPALRDEEDDGNDGGEGGEEQRDDDGNEGGDDIRAINAPPMSVLQGRPRIAFQLVRPRPGQEPELLLMEAGSTLLRAVRQMSEDADEPAEAGDPQILR